MQKGWRKMATVKEVLDLAIEVELIGLAHRVFWAISKGLVTLNDPSERLDTIDYDEKVIEDIVERNFLQIGKIKLYIIETHHPDIYAFYYCENALEAHSLHQEMFREVPKRLTNGSHLMTKIFHFNERGASQILYFQRKQVVSYPYYLGHARAGERWLYRVGNGVG